MLGVGLGLEKLPGHGELALWECRGCSGITRCCFHGSPASRLCKPSSRAEIAELIEIQPLVLETFRCWELAFEEQGKSRPVSWVFFMLEM